MRYQQLPVIILYAFLTGCGREKFHELKTENPAFHENRIFLSGEDLSLPKFDQLKSTYQLDTIFHGETGEFKRILLLRNWIKQHIRIDDIGPYPDNGSAESILDEALKGHGFHCGHYMIVQNAIMNAYGYVTRCIGAGPGVKGGPDGHHGINEVWLNSYHKWFLCDAKYNHHFEKNGIPLSALEVRDEYLKNKAADIRLVKGVDRTPIQFDDEVKQSKENFAQTYTWIEWNRDANKYSNFPVDSSMMIVFDDEYARTHQWIWDGKPHWAYNTVHMKPVSDRWQIEWTPNTIQADLHIEESKAMVTLHSNTPNFKSYQVKRTADSDWADIENPAAFHLDKDHREFLFRAVNTAGVAGPEYKLMIEK